MEEKKGDVTDKIRALVPERSGGVTSPMTMRISISESERRRSCICTSTSESGGRDRRHPHVSTAHEGAVAAPVTSTSESGARSEEAREIGGGLWKDGRGVRLEERCKMKE
eukprot:315720-Rhodomonas_salina.2